jgi:AcrR family transcriptional regulator
VESALPPRPASRGRGRPVNADSEQTRRTILAAARDVISERGYHAATFQQIASRAGVSRPTLHYHFGSREQVYDCLLADVHQRVSACVAEAAAVPGLCRQAVVFVEAMQRLSADDPAAMRFLVTARLEHQRGLQRHDAAHPVVSTVHGFFDTIAHEAVRNGELRPGTDAHAVADMLAALFWGMGFHAGFVDRTGHTAVVARQLVCVLEGGLLNSWAEEPVEA